MHPLHSTSPPSSSFQMLRARSKDDIVRDLSQFFQIPDLEATESRCFELVFNEFNSFAETNSGDALAAERVVNLTNKFRFDLDELRNSENLSLLNVAFKTHNYAVAELLCGWDISTCGIDSEGNQPLHYAAIYDRQSGAPFLLWFLEKSPHWTAALNNSQMNILHLACEHSNEEAVNLIVSDNDKTSTDPFLTSTVRVDDKWLYPLDIALIKGNEEIIHLLLDAISKLERKTDSIQQSLESCITFLVEKEKYDFLFSILGTYETLFKRAIFEIVVDESFLPLLRDDYEIVLFEYAISDIRRIELDQKRLSAETQWLAFQVEILKRIQALRIPEVDPSVAAQSSAPIPQTPTSSASGSILNPRLDKLLRRQASITPEANPTGTTQSSRPISQTPTSPVSSSGSNLRLEMLLKKSQVISEANPPGAAQSAAPIPHTPTAPVSSSGSSSSPVPPSTKTQKNGPTQSSEAPKPTSAPVTEPKAPTAAPQDKVDSVSPSKPSFFGRLFGGIKSVLSFIAWPFVFVWNLIARLWR